MNTDTTDGVNLRKARKQRHETRKLDRLKEAAAAHGSIRRD